MGEIIIFSMSMMLSAIIIILLEAVFYKDDEGEI